MQILKLLSRRMIMIVPRIHIIIKNMLHQVTDILLWIRWEKILLNDFYRGPEAAERFIESITTAQIFSF